MKSKLDEVIQASVEKKMQANDENCFDSEEDKDIEVDDFLCEDSELPKKEYSKINAQVKDFKIIEPQITLEHTKPDRGSYKRKRLSSKDWNESEMSMG